MIPARQPDRTARLRQVLLRDGVACIWCGRDLTGLVRATTEHVVPRVKGGPSWLENEGQRRARPYVDAQLRRLRRRVVARPET